MKEQIVACPTCIRPGQRLNTRDVLSLFRKKLICRATCTHSAETMLVRFFNELPLYRSRVAAYVLYQISFHSRDLRFWLSWCPWRIFNSHEESSFLSDSHAIIGRLRFRGFSWNNETRGPLRFWAMSRFSLETADCSANKKTVYHV